MLVIGEQPRVRVVEVGRGPWVEEPERVWRVETEVSKKLTVDAKTVACARPSGAVS